MKTFRVALTLILTVAFLAVPLRAAPLKTQDPQNQASALMRGYLVSVGIYSVLATLPAVALGLFGGYQLGSQLATTVPIDIGPFMLQGWIVIVGLAVGFGVPVLAALLPLWNSTHISVRDALAAYGVVETPVCFHGGCALFCTSELQRLPTLPLMVHRSARWGATIKVRTTIKEEPEPLFNCLY